MKYLSEYTLVIVFSLLFAASSAFLFWQNDRALDPDQGKSWWTLSFATPQDPQSLDFTVENHSDTATFTYEILSEKRMLSTGIASPKRGESVTIRPQVPFPSDTRVSIVVSDGTETKEIYR